jgi:DNA-directed RNA polymerase specialized sigma24 family protein
VSFDEFVRARLASWLGLATAMSGDAAQGEDIVQEVLIRLHARWDRISAMEYPNA